MRIPLSVLLSLGAEAIIVIKPFNVKQREKNLKWCEALKLKGSRKQNKSPENRKKRLGSFSRGTFELFAVI